MVADRYIANVRQVILKELKGAYCQKMETVERFSYSKGSYFRDPESEPGPEQGAKR